MPPCSVCLVCPRQWTATALALGCAGLGAQELVELQPVQDNSLYSENSSASNGMGDLFVGINSRGERRALMRFDLASLAGAMVLEAELVVTVARTNETDGQFGLHALSQDWGEAGSVGSGQGGPAQIGDATWQQRFFPAVDWTNPGGDFEAAVLTMTTIGAAPSEALFPSTVAFVAQVQDWIDQPTTNFGLIVIPDNAGTKRLDSRESKSGGPILRLNVDRGIVFQDGFEKTSGTAAAVAFRR